jgi:zinc D-Ala-D-Ala carboxypeptidase
MAVKQYPKGSQEPVSPHFQAHEFDCLCANDECVTTLIDEELLPKLEALREAVACPLTITSAYRCSAHMAALRARGYETAKKTSQHELGRAVDVTTGKHSGAEIEVLARKAGFRAVGVARTFVHVDLRGERDRSWSYSKR